MSIRVGDKVAYNRSKVELLHPESWGISFIQHIEFKGKDKRKGVVTKIKTHKWFFFKLENPIYIIDDYYIAHDVKPVLKKYASLRVVLKNRTPFESVWEFHVN